MTTGRDLWSKNKQPKCSQAGCASQSCCEFMISNFAACMPDFAFLQAPVSQLVFALVPFKHKISRGAVCRNWRVVIIGTPIQPSSIHLSAADVCGDLKIIIDPRQFSAPKLRVSTECVHSTEKIPLQSHMQASLPGYACGSRSKEHHNRRYGSLLYNA